MTEGVTLPEDDWVPTLTAWTRSIEKNRACGTDIKYVKFLLEDAEILIQRSQAADRLELEVEHLDVTLVAELQTESRIEKEAFDKIKELEAEIERLQEPVGRLARCETEDIK